MRNLALIEARSIPVPEAGCWLWTGYTWDGYGILGSTHGKSGHRAHRYAYECVNGPIPKGMVACHKCDTRSCVNPAHIFIGTQGQNVADMVSKGRALLGERNPKALLTRDAVLAVVSDTAGNAEIARKLGVHKTTVHNIRSGKSWGHLTGITYKGNKNENS